MKRDEYLVTWAMPIAIARDAEDAARRALAHITRPGSLAASFRVTDHEGRTLQVDLAGEIETHPVDAIVDAAGDHVIGRPLVHVVPSDKHPAAVFRRLDLAERYAAAAGEGWEAEHAVICDDETAEALIAEALRGDA